MAPPGILRGNVKNLKTKISCQTPVNLILLHLLVFIIIHYAGGCLNCAHGIVAESQ
jgi:hypothetical protein